METTLTREQLTKAAQWWLDRIGSSQTQNADLPAFVGALADALAMPLSHGDAQKFCDAFVEFCDATRPATLTTDYEPDTYLMQIAEKSGVEMANRWPFKHWMDLRWDLGKITGYAGRSAPQQVIA